MILLILPAAVHAQFSYTIINNNQVTIVGYNGTGGTVNIPDKIGGFPVTKIGDAAFYNITSMSILTIPASVKNLGADAFYGCTGLTEVYFRGNAPTLGNAFVFYNDSRAVGYYVAGTFGWTGFLGTLPAVELVYQYEISKSQVSITGYIGLGGAVTLPTSLEGFPVTSTGTSAFAGCTTLTSITLSPKVTSIGDSTFAGCTNLTSVTIPAKVANIGNYAFKSCSKLASITIPAKVTSIGTGTFDLCTGLTSITIPSSITSLGDLAFAFCTGLTTVTIPDSITSIGAGAFADCSKLSSAIFRGNAPTMAAGVFDRTASDFTLYYFSGKTGFTKPFWNGYPSVKTGDYSRDFGSIVSLWDISGVYSGVVGQNI
ncbi:MAG: leucine-rich repeat domain-containing protein, partial [Verrucomicrobiota bacterium]